MRAANGQFLLGTHWRPRAPYWDAEWLLREYSVLGRSTGEIASSAGITDAAIIYWLKKHNIPRRSISDARAKKHWGASGELNPMYGKTGAKNPRYVDGSSPERQRMYAQSEGRSFIREILKRDKYKCCRCGAKKEKKKSLHVHHIAAWAGNEELRFDKDNVITLCRNCHSWVHSKANTDQEYIV